MNYRTVFRLLGRILVLEAAAMLPSLFVSLYTGDGVQRSWAASILILIAVGALPSLLLLRKPSERIQPREGFLLVGLAWLTLSLFGALPLTLSGVEANYLDAWFETVSGFTTTGASVLPSPETLPPSLVFWSGFTHWMGGMGVLVLTLVIIPGRDKQNMLRTELTGLSASDRVVPRLRQTIWFLYGVYLGLSALLFTLLVCGGMTAFDALMHTFGTASTGGYSPYAQSVAAFDSLYLETVISVFLVLFSLNFGLYAGAVLRRAFHFKENTELKVFLGLLGGSALMVFADLLRKGVYPAAGTAFRHAWFQTASMLSTAGFTSADFDRWPDFSRSLLLLLMVVGACSGSTGGGLKVVRVAVLVKSCVRELKKMLHPRSVNVVRVGGRALPDEGVTAVFHFFAGYMLLLAVGTLVVSLDGLGLESSFSAVVASVSNIGRGFGAAGSFALFSPLSRVTLGLCMLLGRLEIYPLLLLFMPATWKRG